MFVFLVGCLLGFACGVVASSEAHLRPYPKVYGSQSGGPSLAYLRCSLGMYPALLLLVVWALSFSKHMEASLSAISRYTAQANTHRSLYGVVYVTGSDVGRGYHIMEVDNK